MTNLNQLARTIGEVNTANGWREHPIASRGERLMLIVTEAAEAMEAVRKGDDANYAEELADIIIRALDCADIDGVDIHTAVLGKIERNRGRGYRHGGKLL